MNRAASYAIGADVGATNVKLVAVTSDGNTVGDRRIATDADKAGASWPERVREEITAFESSMQPRASAIGVAAPGLAARDQRSIWWMQGRMTQLVGLDWTSLLNRGRLVPVLNDAHAALLGEAWLGAARGCKNVAMLTLGTGVGGAILFDGKLMRGAIGRAGHLGHVVVDSSGPKDIVNTPGSLEDAIGEHTLAARSRGKFATTKQLLDAGRAGDVFASELWSKSIRALAASLAGIINVVDPEMIILGGGVTQAGDDLFGPLRNAMDEFEWRPHGHAVKIVPATLGDLAVALGAAWYAMNGANT